MSMKSLFDGKLITLIIFVFIIMAFISIALGQNLPSKCKK